MIRAGKVQWRDVVEMLGIGQRSFVADESLLPELPASAPVGSVRPKKGKRRVVNHSPLSFVVAIESDRQVILT